MATSLSIQPVRSGADRRAFRRLPFRLYAGDPHWVPPLNRDVNAFLDIARHPFSESGTVEFFIARRGSNPVGRVAAIENRAHNTFHEDRTGFFGFFEAENDPELARSLIDHAAAWVRDRGLDRLRGPVSPSTNYESGLLVGGAPGPPVLMMPYNPLWYASLLESAGLTKVMDLLAFHQAAGTSDLERWSRLSAKIQARAGVGVRLLNLANLDREVATIIEIYHEAWSENWGFVPLNASEVSRFARELRPVLVPWLGIFAVKDGRDVAFSLGLPDYNQVQIHLKGRLFPFGFLRLLRAKHKIPFMRVLLMGVRKEAKQLGLDAVLYDRIVQECLPRGISENESSWILETNTPMINTLERAGARRYRTYRLFEKNVS